MTKGTIACGVGVAFALALLLPATVSARNGFSRSGLHRAHAHVTWPYGYGPVATYAPGENAAPVVVLPAQVMPAAAPRCVHSRETITVPAEAGGERKVTITRC